MDIRNNLLVDIKKKYIVELSVFYKEEEARQFLNILIQHFFKISKTELALNRERRLSESEILQLHFAVKDLKKNKPIQYITGETEFLGYTFQVNDSVLIPRPETEELVQLVMRNEKGQDLRILDIGTGSACIAIALSKNLANPFVSATDINDEALHLAANNALSNNTAVNFYRADILDEASWDNFEKFDIIVSNPPYIAESEKSEMAENVLNFEPHLALFVADDDDIIFYQKICAFAQKHLVEEGRVYFEINERKGDKIENLLNKFGFQSIKLHKDFREKTRFASAIKP